MIHREHDIIQWAKDRRIIPESTPAAQYSKTLSEWSEWNDKHTKDDIGDTAVTLIIGHYLATKGELLSAKVESMPRVVCQSVADAERLMQSAIEDLADEFYSEDYARCYQYLDQLARLKRWGMDLCLEEAWDDIKDRMGMMLHGLFTKQATLDNLALSAVFPAKSRLESVCRCPEQRSRLSSMIADAGFKVDSKFDKESGTWLVFSTEAA